MNYRVDPPRELSGCLKLPADKSISHRAVMFAALHNGTSTITNFSDAADPHSTVGCFRALGVRITEKEEGQTLVIQGNGRNALEEPAGDLDCGNSGTTMRLLSGIIAGAGIEARLVGDESLSIRTMQRVIDPLENMGALIDAREGDFAPLHISRKGPLKPLRFPLPIPSAQLKSCVLLAGLFGDEPTEVIETLPSRDHTERLLKLPIKEEEGKKIIQSSKNNNIPEQSYHIPNDFSAAAFWLVAGAIHPHAQITLKDVGMNPSRTGALDILQKMGALVKIDNEHLAGAEPVADLNIETSYLQSVNITEDIVPNCIDELPILIIAMLFADGISTIEGAGELRHKETDRLSAMADMLSAAGATFTEHNGGFEIEGNPSFSPQTASFQSYGDHRIAMSAAVLALMGKQSSIVKGGECTRISYPSFWEQLGELSKIS